MSSIFPIKRVLLSNFSIAKGISDSLRTSLGPHGMDKMIVNNEKIIITNDGSTILENSNFDHPAAKLLVEISRSQDEEVGDGTTSIIVLSGSILGNSIGLLSRGFSYHTVTRCLYYSLRRSKDVVLANSVNYKSDNYSVFYSLACSALESKVVSINSSILGHIAATSAIKIIDSNKKGFFDVENIKILKKMGKSLGDTEVLEGLCLDLAPVKSYGGPEKIRNAIIAFVQFDLSFPSTEVNSGKIIHSYSSLDKKLRLEKKYINAICKKIRSSGCNVIIVQKSLLKENVSELALQILGKMGVMVIMNVDREEGEIICKSLGCKPIADINSFCPVNFAKASPVEEKNFFGDRIIFFGGVVKNSVKMISIILRASNSVLLNEAERSLNDALCVIKSVNKKRFLIGGGGSIDIEISITLFQLSKSMTGKDSFCIKSLANAFEIIPYTLAENAGLEPIEMISRLKNKHFKGEKMFGLDGRRKTIGNVYKENIISPLLVFNSILNMSIEFVVQMIKIDDIFQK